MTDTGRPAWVDDELFPFESRWGGPIGLATVEQRPAADMTHYRKALATHHRRDASAVLPRRIAFRAKERQRWERVFADHHTVIVKGAGHFVQEFAAAIRDSRLAPSRPHTLPARGNVRQNTPGKP